MVPQPARQLMKLARKTLVVLAFILILSGILPVGFWLGTLLIESQPVERAEAIVVLGGGVVDRDTLTSDTAQRLLHGVRLFKQGHAPVIVLTGGNPLNSRLPESEVMARIAVEIGVPLSALVVERRADRTWSQGRAVADLAPPRRIRSVLLVTSPLHTHRARRVFEKVGLHVISAPPTSRHGVPGITLWPPRVATRVCDLVPVLYEYGAISLYWWRGWL